MISMDFYLFLMYNHLVVILNDFDDLSVIEPQINLSHESPFQEMFLIVYALDNLQGESDECTKEIQTACGV